MKQHIYKHLKWHVKSIFIYLGSHLYLGTLEVSIEEVWCIDPSISKCNAKRCSCCKHLCCKSTIKSNVNGRQFSVITNSDLD